MNTQLLSSAEIAMQRIPALESTMTEQDRRNIIPPITDPMGKCWEQPKRCDIVIDSESALMTQRDFDSLAEYSTSVPSGVYEGKMWKRLQGKQWWLCWFGLSDNPDMVSNNYRKILIA